MDYVGAMRATIRLAKKNPWWTMRRGCSIFDLEQILIKAIKDKGKNDEKLARQLGWMQAIVCIWSPAEFKPEVFKRINRRFKHRKGKGNEGRVGGRRGSKGGNSRKRRGNNRQVR